jgi:diadenosine tetraphosphatase ApaH/serine/threonine PP2A family protein phosphatase
VLAVLYDIHGNVVALDEVLKDAEAAGADAYLLGGDFASWSPWPLETLERLLALPNSTWIRGNGERWLREPPTDRPEVAEELANAESGLGTNEGWLYSLQPQVELDGVLYVHGSPLSDVESFPDESSTDDERMLAGVRDTTVVFGHSHLQFRRPGPDGTTLLNPGSAGMPLDGDVRAAYAVRHDNGEFEFRRVEYDNERAAQAWDKMPGSFGQFAGRRLRRGSD